MKKTIGIILLLLISTITVNAQSDELNELVKKGVEQHDNGQYEKAIETYKSALKIDKKSPLVHSEIATTYFAMKKYDEAIKHADKVIKTKYKYAGSAYIIKGSALDLQGKGKEAIKVYKKGIKKDPKNHLLHYNLGLAAYNTKDYKTAEEGAIGAIQNKPSHGSSHMLLSYAMNAQNKRVQTILALYYFLMLEADSKRSVTALELLEAKLSSGVKKTGENEISISFAPDDNDDDEFRSAELMLSLLEAGKSLEENKGKTEQELFIANSESFFKVIGEQNKKKKKGFWWTFYVEFYDDIVKAGHNEVFCNYITLSKKDNTAKEWIKANTKKLSAFSKWVNAYEFNTGKKK